MRMRWSQISFLHWSYDAAVVQALLPHGLTIETYDDAAWVGLIPFHMTVAPPVGPEVPWLSYFPETNVRTYVRGPNGMSGIWFFSLDASRLPAVLAARASWGLPYYWSAMHVERRGDRVLYRSTRRGVGSGEASEVDVEAGEPIPAAELTTFENYLTARFVLWAHYLGRLWYTRAEHPAWPLRRAVATKHSDGLLIGAGLPAPEGAPVVHFSEGVDVRVGLPRRVG
ncbi:MAG: YqjF family protein [Actinomycetes bacterium]